MHILVVDDSKFMRRTIKKALDQLGSFTVVEAANGREALAKIDQDQFDLVMSDWNMPVMNGLELVIELRRTHDVPILMLTTVGCREDVTAALQAGVNNYILKPLRTEELQAKLKRIFPDRFP